ncbi:MAG: hypothetical protein U1F55_06140 [Chitinivorax sp.]
MSSGEILSRLGVVPQTLAGAIFTRRWKKGTIDATEWSCTYDIDEKLGFLELPSITTTLVSGTGPDAEFLRQPQRMEQTAEKLPGSAAGVGDGRNNEMMLATYDAKNPPALLRLLQQG